jgi:hypothetical protein
MQIDPKILATMQRVVELPSLRGSDKQIKWALTIRQNALGLLWPPDETLKLRSIDDASWWIANKDITVTMKYKEPAPKQLAGAAPPAAAAAAAPAFTKTRAVLQNSVVTSCLGFAASVSRNPKQAEATILALLAKLYKPPVRDELAKEARRVKCEAEFETGRDLDAINRLLG